MCVLSLLSDEKKHWLKQRVELYGCQLSLESDLFEQIQNLPQHVVDQIMLDVSLREMYSRTSLCENNITQFKCELDKVRTQALSPQLFQQLVINASYPTANSVAT